MKLNRPKVGPSQRITTPVVKLTIANGWRMRMISRTTPRGTSKPAVPSLCAPAYASISVPSAQAAASMNSRLSGARNRSRHAIIATVWLTLLTAATRRVARLLAAAIKQESPDLVLTGL